MFAGSIKYNMEEKDFKKIMNEFEEKIREADPDSCAIDLKQFKKDALNISMALRWHKQVHEKIEEPFGTYLDLAYHLVYIAYEIECNLKQAILGYEDVFYEACRDLRVVLRNFDYLLSRKLLSYMQVWLADFSAPETFDVECSVEDLFKRIRFGDAEYQEWAEDVASKIRKFYSVYRSITNTRFEQFPALEDLLYFAMAGYKIERHKILEKMLKG
jgi:hypothetical protein